MHRHVIVHLQSFIVKKDSAKLDTSEMGNEGRYCSKPWGVFSSIWMWARPCLVGSARIKQAHAYLAPFHIIGSDNILSPNHVDYWPFKKIKNKNPLSQTTYLISYLFHDGKCFGQGRRFGHTCFRLSDVCGSMGPHVSCRVNALNSSEYLCPWHLCL